MGNLPISRTITLGPTDPIPSALINELQDVAIGLQSGIEYLSVGAGDGRLTAGSAMNYDGQDDRLLEIAGTGILICSFPIRLRRGRRVRGVRVHVAHTVATAGSWRAVLRRKATPNASATDRSTQVNSAASAVFQTIVLTGITPTAMAADESWFVMVSSLGGAAMDRYIYGVEIEHDGG